MVYCNSCTFIWYVSFDSILLLKVLNYFLSVRNYRQPNMSVCLYKKKNENWPSNKNVYLYAFILISILGYTKSIWSYDLLLYLKPPNNLHRDRSNRYFITSNFFSFTTPRDTIKEAICMWYFLIFFLIIESNQFCPWNSHFIIFYTLTVLNYVKDLNSLRKTLGWYWWSNEV